MTLAPGSITPQDSLVAPLIDALTVIAQQISGLGTIYPTVPDAPPEDNSILFAPKSVGVHDDETTGKLVLEVELDLIHLFRRRRLQANLALITQYLPAWLTVLTAYNNQTLFGAAQNFNISRMEIAPYVHGEQPYLALVSTLAIRVIWNINQS